MAELPGTVHKPKITHKRTATKKRTTYRKKSVQSKLRTEVAALYSCTNPPSPAQPNGGEIVVCSANEQVSLISSPALPHAPGDQCYFHCPLLWSAPSGWTIIFDPNGYPQYGNPQYGTYGTVTPMALKAPGSISSGNAGCVTLLAEYSQCAAPYNTSSLSIIWVGSTGVSNGLVNGSAGGVPTYVPGGYANLSVQLTGGSDGGSTSWYVATGSGSLSPSYNNCSVSWSGFVRVIVDASNRCGSGGSWTFYLTTEQGYYGYRIGPNPVKDNLSLLLDYEEMVGEVIQGITLYDSNNKAWHSSDVNQLKNRTGDKKVVDITTKGFPRGTYFLHVQYGVKGGKDAIVKSQVVLE